MAKLLVCVCLCVCEMHSASKRYWYQILPRRLCSIVGSILFELIVTLYVILNFRAMHVGLPEAPLRTRYEQQWRGRKSSGTPPFAYVHHK